MGQVMSISSVNQYALNTTILYSMMMGLQGIKLLHVFYFKGGSNLVEETRKKFFYKYKVSK